MAQVSVLGIDLAKQVFHVVGIVVSANHVHGFERFNVQNFKSRTLIRR